MLKFTGTEPCGIDGCLVIEEKELFGATPVTFFQGPPDATALKPGDLGVNIDLFRQVKVHYNKAKENIACRVLADICLDIRGQRLSRAHGRQRRAFVDHSRNGATLAIPFCRHRVAEATEPQRALFSRSESSHPHGCKRHRHQTNI